jgi:16S rRNA processing protein RimM
MADEGRLIVLGVIGAPHGVRGQVKIRSFTADPADITSYGPLKDKNGKVYVVSITGLAKDGIIASISGANTREEAEKLRNIELSVPRSALPEAESGEYYYEDLVGLRVLLENSEPYGIISAVHNFGAGDLVVIKNISGEEELVPFSKTTFPHIDIAGGTALFIPPLLTE